MKTILSSFLMLTAFVCNAQTKALNVTMTDSTYFKYPGSTSMGEARDSNLIVFTNTVYKCNTRINFNFDNNVMFITYPNGEKIKNKIIALNTAYDQIDCDILTETGKFYNFLIAENIDGKTSMIVRCRHKTKDGFVEGYFTNDVNVIK
jgi:hypothetical protein